MKSSGSAFFSRRLRCGFLAALSITLALPSARALEVFTDSRGGTVVELAGREARRYLYIRTGKLPPLAKVESLPAGAGDAVVLGLFSDPLVLGLLGPIEALRLGEEVGKEGFVLRRLKTRGRSVLVAAGQTPTGVYRASARLAEELGVRFAPSGDIIPDGTVSWDTLPELDVVSAPVLEVRGFFPYHSGNPQGPEYWESDDWMLFINQSAKLKLNTIAAILHHKDDGQIDANWTPKWDGPYQIAGAPFGMRKAFTSDHVRTSNAAQWPGDVNLQQRNDANLKMVSDAYAYGRKLGIDAVMGGFLTGDKEHWKRAFAYLAERGFAPRYIWQHTYEDWLYTDPPQSMLDWSVQAFKDFIQARDEAGMSFTPVYSGWTIGPRKDPTLYHRTLPIEVVIAPQIPWVGTGPVDPAYGEMPGRPKWVVPWLEDDFNMIAPQLWVRRTAERLATARGMGITGMLGVHWRRNVISPQMMAMARMAWDGSLNTEAFYLDYAQTAFGPEAGPAIAAILSKVDSNLPRPTDWKDGWPGGIHPDANYWAKNASAYDFVEKLEALESKVKGVDAQSRYRTLLASMRYLRALGQLRSAWGKEKKQQQVTREAYTRLLESVVDSGDLGDLIFLNRQINQGQPQDYQGSPRLIVRTPRPSLQKNEALRLKVVLVERGTPTAATLEWRPLGEGEWKSVPCTPDAGGFVAELPASTVAEGDFEYRITVTSSSGQQFHFPPSRSQTVVVTEPLTDLQPPFITSAKTVVAIAGQPFSYTIRATNTPLAYGVSGLPPGLSFDVSTDTISGVPLNIGTTLVTLSASNAQGTGTAKLRLIVSTLSCAYAQDFEDGTTGGWWFFAGDDGVTGVLNNQMNGPEKRAALNLDVTVSAPPATDWHAGLGTTLNTSPPFGLGDLAGAVLSLDVFISASPEAEVKVVLKTPNKGTLSRTYAVAGNTWTRLSDPLSSYVNDNFDFNASSYEIMVQRGNTGWPLASSAIRLDNVNLSIAAPVPDVPIINSTTTLRAVPGVPVSYTITAENTPGVFGATGLPAGLVVDASTGVISGTPTVTGSSLVVLEASNALGTGRAYLTLEVNNFPPAITSSLSASVKRGDAFSYQITTTPAADRYDAVGLPAGLTLNTATGLISGVPTTEGTSKITLEATNAGGTTKATLALTVNSDGLVVRVNAGGGVVGDFGPGTGFSGGTTQGPGAAVSVAGVPLAGPAEIYDSELWSSGAFTYTSPPLAQGRTFEVRLHFAERHVTGAGQRRFNISINGASKGENYVQNFDPYVAAGKAAHRAVVLVFKNVIPNPQGLITVTFSPGAAQNPMINAVEILAEDLPNKTLATDNTLPGDDENSVKHEVLRVGDNPESVCRGFDGKLYVTVMNAPNVPGDGVVKVIDGNEVRVFATGLDEPKGIAFTGKHLIVADMTRVWLIDASGMVTTLAEADAFPFPPRFLNDVAIAPDRRSVFVSDTGDVPAMFTPGGELWPIDSDAAEAIPLVSRVYRITMEGEVSVAVDARPELPNTNGLLAPEDGLLLVAEFFRGDVFAFRDGQAVRVASGLRGADGLARDRAGRLYVSSWTQGKIWRLGSEGGKPQTVAEGLHSAADFYLDEAEGLLVVPDMKAGTLNFFELSP